MYVGLPRFHEIFFGDVAGLEAASEAVFDKCQEKHNEEGELLKEATDQGEANVARYYHHETVHVRSQVDEIHGNIRRRLISRDAKAYRMEPLFQSADGEGDSGRIAGLGGLFLLNPVALPVNEHGQRC
ncbi:Pkinase_fungal domain-containing protein [Trichoderma simmonsii]|uniref:Pkinase_fungal domain-containing protein n=1 Tax=Trichoderma simmonsii TaxID=1491479 RepID=A0A8G0L5C2_9HYPO|nr:Pkinase_fungal domain-containing protein [Trichoderma simmonsii]